MPALQVKGLRGAREVDTRERSMQRVGKQDRPSRLGRCSLHQGLLAGEGVGGSLQEAFRGGRFGRYTRKRLALCRSAPPTRGKWSSDSHSGLPLSKKSS